MPRLATLIFALSLLMVTPRASYADICGGDTGGGRTANILAEGYLSVMIQSQTNVFHLSGHPFCHGDFYAKAQLLGLFQECSPVTEPKHHTTLGENSLALAQKVCYDLTVDVFYHTGGIHWGFDEAELFTESSSSVDLLPEN